MIIPTEPIGSIPRPLQLIEAVAAIGHDADPQLEPLYDEAIRDTVERFEATGSPVIPTANKENITISGPTPCMGSPTSRRMALGFPSPRAIPAGCIDSRPDRFITTGMPTHIWISPSGTRTGRSSRRSFQPRP